MEANHSHMGKGGRTWLNQHCWAGEQSGESCRQRWMMQQLMWQPILPESRAPWKMSLGNTEVFSSNPVPPKKALLNDLEDNNLLPLKHSLKTNKQKIRQQNARQRPLGKQQSPLSLFLYVMHWYMLVFIFILCRFFETTVIYFIWLKKRTNSHISFLR